MQILEKSLKLLFSTRDVSRVKRYVQKQFLKISEDRAPMQEFIFAKEYRGMSTYKPGACVPALEITKSVNNIICRIGLVMHDHSLIII